MKTRNRIILLLALALTCMITSCESYLDTMPDQRTELNSVRKSERFADVCLFYSFIHTNGRIYVG